MDLKPALNELETDVTKLVTPSNVISLAQGLVGLFGITKGHLGIDTVKTSAINVVNELVSPANQQAVIDAIFNELGQVATTAVEQAIEPNTATTFPAN